MLPKSRSPIDCSSRYVIQAVDLSKALAQIIGRAETVEGQENVGLNDAVGRVLSETITAPLDLPPFDSSAMDGYAFASNGIHGPPPYSMTLVGQSLAGHPFSGGLGPEQCIRITTGAEVPSSADTVVMQEDCERHGDQILVHGSIQRGQYIRSRAHDIQRDELIAPRGKRLNPFDVAWLAACGINRLSVTRKPRIAVFSTGDELVEPGGTLVGGQIFDANRFALLTLLEQLPVHISDLGILPDDLDAIRSALKKAAHENDLLLTSGGVSVGDADYVREVVEEIGTIELWKLNLKPGKPLAFGNIDDTLFVGLPGNPVSTIVTYLLIARPLMLRLAGVNPEPPQSHMARLSTSISHNPGREEYQRGFIIPRDGTNWVTVSGDQSSNRLATFNNADCLIRIPKNTGDLNQGEEVEILPFSGMAF